MLHSDVEQDGRHERRFGCVRELDAHDGSRNAHQLTASLPPETAFLDTKELRKYFQIRLKSRANGICLDKDEYLSYVKDVS